ncbi:Hypothetical predicted protein [Marmota monax]|uniref:B30.2/SPRY domain-containing protein n=1 Tax=Marmota monax TaxID=9995 RepID=A0A5E4AS49_MARMO|nr:hypothetical protein GHT09_010965 [Marmota monax]VTJ59342.1 Hypothetical predicted protein [Marmota monax]
MEVRKVQANVENEMLIIASDSQKHQGRVTFLSKLIQTMRDEVNTCFSEIIHEIKQLQIKVLDFVEKEEATALGKLGSSIQQSHNRLLKLEGDSVWLHTLLTNRSDEQFLQARPYPGSGPAASPCSLHPQTHQICPDLRKTQPYPSFPALNSMERWEFPKLKHIPVSAEPLMGTSCEETQSFLQLPETLAELRTQLVDMGLSFVNQLLMKGYCNLNFDPSTASEELFLFKETHSVLNLGILLEPSATGGPVPGFKQWPQVLCSRGLSEGHYYWEAEVSNSWMCLGVTYRRSPQLNGVPRRNIVYLLGRNPYSWCLEWDSLKFSVWHNNTQTVLHGAYHRTLGVALDCAAGCLSFYGVAGGVSLLYRFLATFLEPLFPAVMVSSGASVTLKQRPDA